MKTEIIEKSEEINSNAEFAVAYVSDIITY